MSPRPQRRHRAPRSLVARSSTLLGAALLGVLPACGADPGPVVEIDASRVATRVVSEVRVGATADERFGRQAPQESAPRSLADELTWEVPPTWTRVAPRSRFRDLDFVVAGDPRAEATLSVLPSRGGGLLDNLNRWRDQLGRPPLTPAEVVGLPRAELFGNSVPYLVVDGEYSGMAGGEPIPDARLLGLVLVGPEFSIFVKLTAPREVALAEEEAFLAFARSLRPASPAGDEHDHDGDGVADHAPGAHGEPSDDAPAGRRIAWTPPAGWAEQPAGQFTLAAFRVGDSSRATVSRAGGAVLDNLVRWYGQLGLEPPADPIAATTRLEVLGADAYQVELRGDFAGMGGPAVDDALLLGLIVPLGEDSLFVKLLGPESEARGERLRFLEFVGTLRWEDAP